MKPLTHSNLSAFAYVGLFILFMLPYVGTPALIICAFLIPDGPVKKFARAMFWISLIIVLAAVIGGIALSAGGYYEFPLLNNDGLEAFNSVLNIA